MNVDALKVLSELHGFVLKLSPKENHLGNQNKKGGPN